MDILWIWISVSVLLATKCTGQKQLHLPTSFDLPFMSAPFIHGQTNRIMDFEKFCVICDWACKNQPCERNLHLVRYSTSVLKRVFSFYKLYKILH